MLFKKSILIAFSAVTALTFIFTSCSKNNNNNGGGNGAVSATISGSNFSPSLSAGYYSTDSTLFEIAGYNFGSQDTTILGVFIFSPITVNTVMPANMVSIEYYHTHTQADYVAGAGVGRVALTVTSLDTVGHKISGNFTGTMYNTANAKDSVLVTNGKFSLSYISQP